MSTPNERRALRISDCQGSCLPFQWLAYFAVHEELRRAEFLDDSTANIALRTQLAKRLLALGNLLGFGDRILKNYENACRLLDLVLAQHLQMDADETGQEFLPAMVHAADAGLLDETELEFLDNAMDALNRQVNEAAKRHEAIMYAARRLSAPSCSYRIARSPRLHLRHRRPLYRRAVRRVQTDAGGEDGDGEPPELPIRYCTKALGTDESRGLPPGDGFHRPRTFAPQQDGTSAATVRPGEVS